MIIILCIALLYIGYTLGKGSQNQTHCSITVSFFRPLDTHYLKGYQLEPIKIVRRRLEIPEPKQLWTLTLKERKSVITEAKKVWAEFRAAFGFKVPTNVHGLTFGTTPKDNQKYGKSKELIYGLSLAQSNLSGINVCHWSSPECRKACVGYNGNAGFPAVMRARIAKTKFLFEHPEEAGIILADFWEMANRKAILGNEVGGRINTFSDLVIEEVMPWIFERFRDINFFDYTKNWSRDVDYIQNYHLTYSASEKTTDDEIIDFVSHGKNVAVVFSPWGKKPLPSEYLGFPVMDGDTGDVRWKDKIGVIVGLRRKGSLKASSPMVRPV